MSRSPVAYVCREDLNARIDFLGREGYHLFINGQWFTTYDDPGELLKACRKLGQQGRRLQWSLSAMLFSPRPIPLPASHRSHRLLCKVVLELSPQCGVFPQAVRKFQHMWKSGLSISSTTCW